MKFRTEIEVAPFEKQIEYGEMITTIGSCFASSIGERLSDSKFPIAINPMGVMFNPKSIERTVARLVHASEVNPEELQESRGVWFHYDFHGSFSCQSREDAIAKMNGAVISGHESLQESQHVIITLGTAWIYERVESGDVVANCHKQPSKCFVRQMMSVEQVEESLRNIVSMLGERNIILTVSPIRHIADGLDQNSLSKAVLRVAVANVVQQCHNVSYFPSYELLIDDLRDYRFYDTDMVHPSDQAVEYIWEKFQQSAISAGSKSLMLQVMQIVRASQHRPFNPHSEEFRRFCKSQLEKIEKLPQIDFGKESAYFNSLFKN